MLFMEGLLWDAWALVVVVGLWLSGNSVFSDSAWIGPPISSPKTS